MVRYFVILIIILIQSCSSLPKHELNVDCEQIDSQIALRYSLFSEISPKIIKNRSKIDIRSSLELEKLSVFGEIVKSVKSAVNNSNTIGVDLRYYKSVDLGNIVVSNMKNDEELEDFLENSKYSQGFFALINFGEDKITLFAPKTHPYFEKTIIKRSDLHNSELVLNISNSKNTIANMKFSKNQKISIIADNIEKPFRIDVREASNIQHHLNQKWIMQLYSIKNSELEGGKVTTGFFKYVNNDQTKSIQLHKFDKSQVMCYKDELGMKFY